MIHVLIALLILSPFYLRTNMVRVLKGLEDVISITFVHPVWQKTKPEDPEDKHTGWVFGDADSKPLVNTQGLGGPFPPAYPNNEPEPFYGSKSIRELYERAGDTDGKYSVPVLWDKKLNTIVSNESSEIIRMLNTEFNEFARNPDLDLYPEEMRESIDEVNSWVYPTINNGVYRCGFVRSQEAYDEAIGELTKSMDRISDILSKQRYIAGDRFTEADIRLFVTLLRFDEVYTVYFKCNSRSVMHDPALLNYVREIYQMEGIANTVDMNQIKTHYYASHPDFNKWSVVPRGPDFMRLLQTPHNRNEL
jgi:glutathionyl-hydroquinone reductase